MTTGKIRVLVVDDFNPYRQWVSTFLDKHGGFEVTGEAANAKEAVEKAQELVPDLILLDVGLPDKNGVDAQMEICRVAPCAKIVFLTTCADGDVVQCALGNGAKGYVLKSHARRELLHAIETSFSGGIFVSRRIQGHDTLHNVVAPA